MAKSDIIVNFIDTSDNIEKLLKAVLEERYSTVGKQHTKDLVVDSLLSTGVTYNVGHRSSRQALHRDDMIHSSKSGFVCRLRLKLNELYSCNFSFAGSRVMRDNGGTMLILGWLNIKTPLKILRLSTRTS